MNKEESSPKEKAAGSPKEKSAEPAPQPSDTQLRGLLILKSKPSSIGTENLPRLKMHTLQLHKLRICIFTTLTLKWISDAWSTTSKL
jgi:hypothetical protein